MAKRARKSGTGVPPVKRSGGGAGRKADGPPVGDYRHHGAKRKNNPPAKIAAEGTVPVVPKAEYAYNPHLPPVLRFQGGTGILPVNRESDHGLEGRATKGQATISPDELPPLIAEAGHRPLTPDEQKLLAEALRRYEPWLEWTGKREAKWFEVDPVALHIHERVSTQAILKIAARQDVQRSLFADPEQEYHEAVQFYRHDVDWANRLILGDSLQVMSSLARREDLAGKVQMIYIDPPYGIKFASNFQPEVGRRDVKDKEQDLTREPEMVRAYRDTWHLGIHSYLSYLRDRLIVARELLADTGSIFVQISDENLHRVHSVMDEVFGSSCFIALINFAKTSGATSDYVPSTTDYLLWYARSRDSLKYRAVYDLKTAVDEVRGPYSWTDEESGERRRLDSGERHGDQVDPNRLFRLDNLQSQSIGRQKGTGAACWFPVNWEGKDWLPGAQSRWKTNEPGMERLRRAERLAATGGLYYLRFLRDFPVKTISNSWGDTSIAGFASSKVYVVETSSKVIERCMLMTTDPGDLVLDPTCGSGTTAYVAEQWGRRWITIDTSRVAIAIARQRLLTAKYDMYRLRGTAFQAVGSGDIDQAAHRQDACATGGTAFQAVGLHANQPGAHGQDARATYELVPYNPREVSVRYSAYLPHWEQEGATYAVTFRLADSLPREVLEGWLRERQAIVRRAEAAGRCLTATEQRRLRELHSERVEKYLDTGRGACALKDERAARIVRDALLHFDGERYDVIVWCVMPNHVHVVVRPRPGHELSSILHSWKSFTSNEVNKVLGLQSALWQPDSFDHLIRDTEDLERSVQYVLDNPGAAGLSNWPWAGCGTAFQAVGSGDINQTAHRQDACATGGTAFQAVTQGEDQWGTHGQDARATGGTAFQAVGLHADQPGAHGQDARATNPARGFVYKTVPHITLKSIAQNVALDPIFAKHEPILDKALGGCNNALAKVTDAVRVRLCMKLAAKAAEEGVRAVSDADARRWLLPGTTPKMLRDALEDAFSRVKRNLTAGQRRSLEERIPSIEPSPQPSPSKGEGEGPSPRPSPVEGEGGWQQWQVPFDTDDDWPAALRDAVTAYRESWRAKMDEVNACIAASAEQEELVDDPKRVPGITRVTGPFTVEAVQPPEMALGDNIDPYTRGTGFQPVVQPVEDHGLDHGQNHGQDACPGFQPVENHGQDAHATQEGLFDGAPEELPDGFEPRTLRMVEPTNELEVANVTAYLDQMFRYLKADGVRFLNNRQMRWIRFEPLFESGRAGIFHAEGRWLAVANGKGPLPQPSPLKGEGEEGGPNNVAVVFGPQYGPVTAAVVEEAIRQSLRAGYEHLLIAGFSFDGAATGILSEGVEPGVFQGPGRKRVHVHFAHVRPDINPGMNGLLKESPQPGAGQLFSVFGLPRVRVEKRGTAFQRVGETGGHGQDAHATRGTAFQAVRTGEDQSGAHGQDARATDEYVVEMQGVDIYNPVDNSITSTGASKVAAWFLDSDYDGRTFCITQAFFPDRSAWDKLARALNGKDGPIDADRFEAFSGTKSLPFPAGKHRCVAVKVIDPRGNEVMCVRRLDSRS